MATLVKVGYKPDEDDDVRVNEAEDEESDAESTHGNGEAIPLEKNRGGVMAEMFNMIGDSQAGVVELSSLITNPGLKRAESSEVLNLTLHQCARNGNPDLMRRLLQSLTGNVKKKINAHDEEELSPLHYASRYNHYHIVKMLIEFGAAINDVDVDDGATPLHFAARYKRMRLRVEDTDVLAEDTEDGEVAQMAESSDDNSVILYIVSQGAKVNVRDNYGCSPLHYAAMRGNEVATKELLSCRDINIEAVDKQQMTALHMAASHNENEVCRMLIEAGANLRCCDEEEATPLHYACMEGSLRVAQMLFEAGEKQDGWVTVSQMMTDQDNQQNTPLHYAVENRGYEVAKLCIEKGADVNTPRSNYSTPLHLAAVAGELDIVKLLVDHQARIDALDINQSTPLHKAAAFNHAHVVDFLLERKAKIDKPDKDNFSPLLLAALNGHAETIKTLLNKGANLFHKDKNDKTAIFWSAAEDQIGALTVLLNHHRARELIDNGDRYCNTPLHIAAQNGFLGCVKALLEAGADMDAKNEEEQTPLHLAARCGKTKVVRELVRRNKMVINDEDEDSNTALHLAALSGHNKVVSALITAGANIEARNCSLWTPLDCAAAKGWTKTVRELLEADAPIDPMDKSKTTPLHLASGRGHVQVVEILLKWHADVTIVDSEGSNCLDLAIDNGRKEAALAIINSDKWQQAMRNVTVNEKDEKLRNTPMRKLIRKMPDVAERLFQRCTTSRNHPDHPDYEVIFNYEFLDDMYANWSRDDASDITSSTGSIYDEEDHLLDSAKPYATDSTMLKLNHPLMLMVKSNQEDLLAHPLVTSLLRWKWNSYGRYVYYLNLCLYCVFLVFLTGYVCTTTAPYMYTNASRVNISGSQCDKIDAAYNVTQSTLANIGKYVIMVLAAVNLLREVFQMFNAKMNYFGWENLIEWVTYISSLLLVIDFEKCQEQTGIRFDWQWNLAAVAIFLAWIDLVLFIRKFPRFGIYVVMFTDVCYTFLQFFPVFFLFIVAFALAFFVLLQNQYAFRVPEESLMKTSVMMIGEFEYAAVFLGLDGIDPNSPDAHAVKVYYQGVTYALFVAFLILMSIIIMNLLVGLAVDDIKAVQESAVLQRLAMQVELALDVESVLPQIFRRKFVVKCKSVRPNLYSKNPFKRCIGGWDSSFMSSAAITKALNPDLDDMEKLQENQDKIMGALSNFRQRIKGMEQQNSKLESMLTALLQHQGVDFQDEDVTSEEAASGLNTV